MRALGAVADRYREVLDVGRAARLGGLEGLWSHQDDRRLARRAHRRDLRSAEVRDLRDESAIGRRDVGSVRDEAAAKSRREAARDVAGVAGEAE